MLPTPSATTPALDTFGAGGQKLVDLATFIVSLGAHVLVAVLAVGLQVVTLDLDGPGAENGSEDGPAGNNGGEVGGPEQLQTPPVPVRVTVYQPGAPKSEETPKPPPKQTPPTEATAEAAPPEAPVTPEGDGNAKKEGVAGKPPRGNKKACDPVDEIVQVHSTKWKVERSLIDWYAVHLRELEKQAGVAVHKGDDGKRDGARLYLPRCSVLRQAGFRGGDVVHSVNGHKVTSIANGVKTYAKVRNDKILKVDVTRKNGTQLTLTYKLVH